MATGEPWLFIKLYTDADITRKLASLLRQRSFDAISAFDVGNAEINDSAQLEYAVERGRAILTFNIGDFRKLYDEYWNSRKDHCGIIVSEQLPVGELARRVLKLLDEVDAEQMKNSFHNLGEFK